MISVLVLLLVVILGFAAYVRLAPSKSTVWHVDPLSVSAPAKPNHDLMRNEGGTRPAVSFAEAPADLLGRLDQIAKATPGVSVLAGSPAEGHVTYVARSVLWGFPDYVSVKAVENASGGSDLVAFSRARFGYSDMGVNGKRMDAWLAALGG